MCWQDIFDAVTKVYYRTLQLTRWTFFSEIVALVSCLYLSNVLGLKWKVNLSQSVSALMSAAHMSAYRWRVEHSDLKN